MVEVFSYRTFAFWIPWGIFKNFMRSEILRLLAGVWSTQEGTIYWNPPAFEKPILFGPYMANFAAIAAEMKAKGGGVEVRGVEDLVCELTDLLSDADKRRDNGRESLSGGRG